MGLWLIGDVFGEEKNFLENKIITNDLENNIEITGWLSYNDVPKSIADCSIGLITNTNEKRNTLAGPPNKLFNYMTMIIHYKFMLFKFSSFCTIIRFY